MFSSLLASGEPPRLSASSAPHPRARVTIVQDTRATDAYIPVPDRVRALVSAGITNFTGKADLGESWRSIVSTRDIVGIKVFSTPGSQVGTRLDVVDGVVEGLLHANIPATNIVIWDRRLSDLQRAGFTQLSQRRGVRLAGSLESGWDTNVFYESSLLGQLVYGDHDFQGKSEAGGRKSYVTRLVTKQLTKIINISPLLNHNSAGVCGNLYSLAMGSVDNSIRFDGERSKLSTAIPEIYALPEISEKVALNIVDALICQYQGEKIGHLHYSAALDQLRFSTDPVALDVLSIREIEEQRARVFPTVTTKTNRWELFKVAEWLEHGVADPRVIDVDFVDLNK